MRISFVDHIDKQFVRSNAQQFIHINISVVRKIFMKCTKNVVDSLDTLFELHDIHDVTYNFCQFVNRESPCTKC